MIKTPKEMTLAGLILRLVALKLQCQILNARRKALRAEVMERLPKNIPQIVAGWRVRLGWRAGGCYQHVQKEGWHLYVRRPVVGQRETTF
jgi:hypothetical protein